MNFKNLMACMVAMIVSTTAIYAQCNFTLGDNWTNLTTCTPNTASVGGTVSLTYPSGAGGNDPCPGSSVNVQLQKFNGSTWAVSQSTSVNTGFGSNTYGFTGITAGTYRIVGFPSPGSSCGGCGFTTFTKTSQTVTINNPVVAGWNINSSAASMTSPYQGYGYNCGVTALTWNNTSSGTTTNSFQWKLYYQECNSTGGGLTGLQYGETVWKSTALANSYDLKTFGTYMGTSAAVGKYFLITLEIKNSCSGTSSIKQGIVFINSAPSNPAGVLKLNGGTAPTSNQSASHTIGSPNLAKCAGVSFNLTSTTGTMFYYKAAVEQVNCSTGAYIQDVLSPTGYTFISSSFYSGLNLNSLPEYSPTGYFVNNCSTLVLNNCYKLTVTYGNQCATASEWTYFKIDGAYKTDETFTDVNELQSTTAGSTIIQLSPNPANNFININIDAQESQYSSIKIYDMTGREVMAIAENFPLVRGENLFNVDINSLSPGTYITQIISADGYRSSLKFIKNN